jgi:type IV pilus assembly protein PilY1
LYAFDVTNPASPSLKWKQGCPNNFPVSGSVDDSGCTSNMSGIGQTWSPASPFKASGYNGPLLIMGGGYDPCEDDESGNSNNDCSSTKGNHVYVFDANYGTLLKTLDTDRAVVGEIFIVPGTSGNAKFAYATDAGGNVYRISGATAGAEFASTAPSGWNITKIASLGCDSAGTCDANRKFMFGPDVVEDNGVYYVMAGSGDREKPIQAYTVTTGVTNYFFVVQDKPGQADWLTSQNSACGANVMCLASLLPISGDTTPSAADFEGKRGWYLSLSPTEQVVTSAITVYGNITFSTHQPAQEDAEACQSNLGTTKVYNINFTNAAPAGTRTTRSEDVAGDGLPPSPVAGMVTLDDGSTVPFVIGASPDSPLEAYEPTFSGGGSQPKTRVYWYIQQ